MGTRHFQTNPNLQFLGRRFGLRLAQSLAYFVQLLLPQLAAFQQTLVEKK